ncbi:hypothetical protein BDM02DRAFT_1733691 [Thelephora ganbajun]|uniref:Uncharacterized protein n=1 Tax=Thelephora ganbajun TaxID=370292 RepID=A0ACB6ZKB5_THEGA|nr:hypothetical protein BDM02DRAFT_1733691 [Thelephora ganbajun]
MQVKSSENIPEVPAGWAAHPSIANSEPGNRGTVQTWNASVGSGNSDPHPIHPRKSAVSHADNHLFHLAIVSNRFLSTSLCLGWLTRPLLPPDSVATFVVVSHAGDRSLSVHFILRTRARPQGCSWSPIRVAIAEKDPLPSIWSTGDSMIFSQSLM